MTSTDPSTCPACGAPATGKFCSTCGTPRGRGPCAACGLPLAPGARFCSGCGRAVGSAEGHTRDRTPWIIAGAAVAALLAVILITLTRKAPEVAATEPAGVQAEAPPDISNMSPRERFNRLYNRVMQAAQSGDEATVSRFTPMALMAYEQLDTVDADARYHVALLKAHTGDVAASRALADSILSQTPGHLFGYIIRGTMARFQKDEKTLRQAYGDFLKHYDAEMKAGRPEYQEHRTAVEDFRKASSGSKTASAETVRQ